MGRHSSQQHSPYYRSVFAWFFPWLVVAVVAVTGVWMAVAAVGRDAIPARPARGNPPSERADAPEHEGTGEREHPRRGHEEAGDTGEADGGGGEAAPRSEARADKPERAPKRRDVELVTEDVTVQVLNATPSPNADHAMVDRLSRLGFEIVAVDSSSVDYGRTTVFWSGPAARRAATALARRFGWEAGAKPANLSSTVSLHVVVGADEA